MFYIPVFYFCKCIFIFQRHFAIVFHPWIYCTLIRLTLFTTSLTPSSLHLIIQQISVHFIMLSSYTGTMYFIIMKFPSFSFPLPAPHSPFKLSHYYKLVFSLDR
jgi:hypothetical protein